MNETPIWTKRRERRRKRGQEDFDLFQKWPKWLRVVRMDQKHWLWRGACRAEGELFCPAWLWSACLSLLASVLQLIIYFSESDIVRNGRRETPRCESMHRVESSSEMSSPSFFLSTHQHLLNMMSQLPILWKPNASQIQSSSLNKFRKLANARYKLNLGEHLLRSSIFFLHNRNSLSLFFLSSNRDLWSNPWLLCERFEVLRTTMGFHSTSSFQKIQFFNLGSKSFAFGVASILSWGSLLLCRERFASYSSFK